MEKGFKGIETERLTKLSVLQRNFSFIRVGSHFSGDVCLRDSDDDYYNKI